jgi:dTDP-4-dehydrorhamnose reductase
MPIKTILVTGSQGQVGQSLQQVAGQYPQYQFTFVNRQILDLSQADQIQRYFQHHQYDLIINCAAYTAVDQAEQEPESADKLNHLAVKHLAEITRQHHARLIHISTDYVFDGQGFTPYSESERTNPQTVYGLSKLMGELAIQDIPVRAIIIRTSWVYAEWGHNFVKTMLKLGQQRDQLRVVSDQIGSPTYAKDLALAIINIVEASQTSDQIFNPVAAVSSVYHYSNEGVCSWYDFAKAIFELSHTDCQLIPIESKDYPTPATRPCYSVLNKTKIKQQTGLNIPYWKDSLRNCLENLGEAH